MQGEGFVAISDASPPLLRLCTHNLGGAARMRLEKEQV
jgi:hypothetical protein